MPGKGIHFAPPIRLVRFLPFLVRVSFSDPGRAESVMADRPRLFDTTAAMGLNLGTDASGWVDFNWDGHLEVYVSNYRLQPNHLLFGDGLGGFPNVTTAFNAVAASPGFEGDTRSAPAGQGWPPGESCGDWEAGADPVGRADADPPGGGWNGGREPEQSRAPLRARDVAVAGFTGDPMAGWNTAEGLESASGPV